MKKAFFFLILSCSLTLYAQEPINIKAGCSFDGNETESEYYTFDPSDEATQIVNRILQAMGLNAKSFTIKESNVKNALATTEGRERYILYSTAFLEKFKGNAKTKWAAYTVLAHEIGHHLNNHDFNEKESKRRKSMELDADRFAGSVCRTLGATLAEALAGMESMDLPGETTTHPTRSARVAAVANGWKKQDELLIANGSTPPPITPPSPDKETKPISAEPTRKEPQRGEGIPSNGESSPGGGNIPASTKDMVLTPRRIFENYLAAIGGQGKINQIKDIEVYSDIEMGNMLVKSRVCYKKNGKFLEQLSMDGSLVSERKCNGYQVVMQNIMEPEPSFATGHELEYLLFNARNFIAESSYLNQPNIHQIKYLGTQNIEGKNYHTIQITRPHGGTATAYYDTKTFLKAYETETMLDNNDETIEMHNQISNYRWVDGIYQPFTVISENSKTGSMTINLRSIRFNQNLSDALFAID